MISVLSKLVMKKLHEKEFEEEHIQIIDTEKEIRHDHASNLPEESGVKNEGI